MSNQIDIEASRRWLLRSKLELPRNSVRLVQRARLLARMDRWLDLDLAMVIAPAGYAKSTTIAEWCRHAQRRGVAIAWLSLDEADAEPAQFLSYVIAALSAAGLDLESLEIGAEEGFFASGIATVLSAVLDAVQRFDRRLVLVFDDYHRVGSPAVDQLVRAMLQGLSRNMTMVVASRTTPAFDMIHLLANGRADEMTSATLSFTADELAAVFEQPIGPDAIAQLMQRTEGWPVAVQLAKLLVADGRASDRLAAFHGDSGHIATYLTEQIVSDLAPDLQSFLLRTAPLDRFNVELAAAVNGDTDSLATLARLEPLGALIVPLDEEGGGYRYHHLFAEYLRNELRRQQGDAALADVHRRASLWYEDNDYMPDAVRHARLAGDFDRCARLIETAGGWELILFGGIGYLRGLLQQLPEPMMQEYPRIAVAKAYSSLKDGLLQQSRTLVDIAASAREALSIDDAALDRDLLNVSTLLSVYEDHHIDGAMMDKLEHGLSATPANDPVTRAILSCQLVVYELALGWFASADRRAQQTMRTMRQARSVLGLNYCYLHAGIAALYQGRLKASEAHFGVAQRMADANFAYDPGLRALSRLLASTQRFWAGEVPAVPIDQLRADLEQVEHFDGWLDIYYFALLVEHGTLRAPDAAVSRARRIAQARGLNRLHLLADAFVLQDCANTDKTQAALTLRRELPEPCWRDDPFQWLAFIESRLGLAAHFSGIDRSRAIAMLNEGLICARQVGASLHVLRLLIMRAHLLDLSGDRSHGIEDMIEALVLAAPESAFGPFLVNRAILPLLRVVARQAKGIYVDILVLDFANHLISRLSAASAGDEGGDSLLSGREREVLEELAQGRSNKEIARLLDMTEHTVKFHLKNIFAKLEVSRRTQAVARARALNLV